MPRLANASVGTCLWLALVTQSFALEAEIPRLLKDPETLIQQICQDSTHRFALIARKTHRCDNTSVQKCLAITTLLSEPCNDSLRNHFEVFHTRKGRYEDFSSGRYVEFGYSNAIDQALDRFLAKSGQSSAPGIIVVDTLKCSAIASIFLYEVDTSGSRWLQARSLNGKLKQLLPEPISELNQESFEKCERDQPLIGGFELWRNLETQEAEL